MLPRVAMTNGICIRLGVGVEFLEAGIGFAWIRRDAFNEKQAMY